jgi:hypothetical protein
MIWVTVYCFGQLLELRRKAMVERAVFDQFVKVGVGLLQGEDRLVVV